jgi:tRNA (Thr-GGU) A37 N-methylase
LVKIDKLDKINGFLYLSSIDLIDGTPILDVKPYIPSHDQPMEKVLIADWVE